MNHWLIESSTHSIEEAYASVTEYKLLNEFQNGVTLDIDWNEIFRATDILELAVLDLLQEPRSDDNNENLSTLAAKAFYLLHSYDQYDDAIKEAEHCLKFSCLAVLGDKTADASRVLKEHPWTDLPLDSHDWKEKTYSTVLDIWLRLIRKDGWDDRDLVLRNILDLRSSQQDYEREYLESLNGSAKSAAWELVVHYHLAKAAEILALFITDGHVDGNYQIRQLLESQFDRAIKACEGTQLIILEPLTRLLAECSQQLVKNSIWTVTRAVNSRVTKFVETLVDKGRGDKVIFDVLPPQRRTLSEQGLLGSSRRAVVVSLPTSSGKTLIAQFRILQALNQFEDQKGWVAYLAPTKALVNQITRKLRKDFSPLGIGVEQVSPALEIDSIEAQLLNEKDDNYLFRVLVTTPEKLDLILRQGWEEKIERPVTLVVVDEAHNIQDETRGLKLELLLSTINKECRYAQFLLLTPFINNAEEVARWLGDDSSDDISLALDWQPNDRTVGIVNAVKDQPLPHYINSFSYTLEYYSKHTTRNTLFTDDPLILPDENLFSTFSKVNNVGALAAETAQALKHRGPQILLHSTPTNVWTLAKKIKVADNLLENPSSNIKLVQDYLAEEYGHEFELIELLNYGIGIHHSGITDEARSLIEWLFESEELNFLIATTTIAQGVNFPVSGVVMATHQYPYGKDMPPEDFWNLAGRAGRVDQGSLGVIALVAENDAKVAKLERFINKQSEDLNSALIRLVQQTIEDFSELDLGKAFLNPQWSAFLQYLAHTYRMMGDQDSFVNEIEQVLRGTLGFESLRKNNSQLADYLLNSVNEYTNYLSRPSQPLAMVDSTGFSLQTVNRIFQQVRDENIKIDVWNEDTLFNNDSNDLRNMMGVLLNVPELKNNLEDVLGGDNPNGNKLSEIVIDWVTGKSIPEIAETHFDNDLTRCCSRLFGKLTQTTSWGLSALLSITAADQDLSEDEFQKLSNLPARVFYGVNSDEAICLRLLGIPRYAAQPLAENIDNINSQSIPQLRATLRDSEQSFWCDSLGDQKGRIYQKVWRILEGVE